MMEYLLKVSVVLVVGLLFYKAVLQQESFFGVNRFYLICCLLLAFALPLITLPRLVQHQGVLSSLFSKETPSFDKASFPNTYSTSGALDVRSVEEGNRAGKTPLVTGTQTQSLPQLSSGASEKSQPIQREAAAESAPIGWMTWLLIFYGFGVGVFVLNLLFQVISLFWKVFNSPDKIEDGEFVIVNTNQPQAPCSFFKYIFLHPNSYDYDTYEQIVAHEKIHVRQGHTYDLLFAELAVVLLWFNPLAWMFKKEVEKNIEYQTDAILLEKENVQPSHYQMSLLKIACPNKPLSITTNYNQSLLKQRIMMMNSKKSSSHAFWKYAFLAPLFFGTMLLLNEPATSQKLLVSAPVETTPITPKATTLPAPESSAPEVPAQQPIVKASQPVAASTSKEKEKPERKETGSLIQDTIKQRIRERVETNENTINTLGRSTDMSHGLWYGYTTAKEYCVDLKGSRSTSSWNISRCFDKKLFSKKGDGVYVMTKEAGTLQLNGNLDEEVSQGKYTFTPDASFSNYLTQQNIATTNTSQNLIFFLFLGNVDKNYISYLKSNYQELSGKRLEELAIHGISMEEYKGYMALFQKTDDRKPSMSEVVEAKIHGISQEYVQQIQSMGFKDLPLRKMMEAKIHGVTPAYAQELKKAGFENLTLSKITEAKIHGITPAYVNETKKLGFGDLTLNKVIEMKIHGVTPTYVLELKSAGFDNLTLSKVTEAKIHGVNAKSIKEIQALGFKNLSLDKIISMKIHRVNADFLSDLKAVGFADMSADKAIEAKIHGVTGDFIKKARQEGYNLKTLDEYIHVKIMGMGKRAQRE